MWASPNDRIPGVSITQPPKLSGSATDCDRRMPALADVRYLAGGPICLRYKAIHQRRFADTGMAEQHRHLVGQQRRDDVEWVVAARGGDRQVEIGELLGERFRRGEIGLGQAQDRFEPAGVGGDQCALDEDRCAVAGRPARPRSAAGRRWRRRRVRSGSVSSAVRRNTVRRSPRRTMRASVSGRPDRSPTMPTSSPTTIGVRPSSRARIAVTRWSGSRPSAHPQRPRSTVTTMASCASACSGRVLVRGREPRPGRTRTSDSSYSRGLKSPSSSSRPAALRRLALEHVGPHLRELRQRLCRRTNVFHLDAGHPQPDDGARRRHPMVGIGLPHPAVQRAGGDDQPVGCFLALPTEPVDFGGQRREPVGLVPAQMRDPAQLRHRTVAANAASAATAGVSSPTSCRSTSKPAVELGALHLEVRTALAHNRTELLQDRDRIASAGWMLTCGQPVTRTIPPLTTAAARNGTALDRSGSMIQCRARNRAGRDPPAVGLRVVDVDAGIAQHRHRHRDVRRRRHRLARCARSSVRR